MTISIACILAIALWLSVGLQASPPADNLVRYWPFDESTGITATNVSGAGGTITFANGPTWVAGRVGGAARLGAATTTSMSPVTVGANHTLSLWLNASSGAMWTGLLESGCCRGLFYRADLRRIAYQYNDGSRGATHLSAGVLPLDQWVHIAIVSTLSSVTLYLNGVVDSVFPALRGTLTFNSLAAFRSGLVGSLDDLRIYTRGLTQTEVTSLYNFDGGGAAPPDPAIDHLVGYWRLDESQGSIAQDTSGHNSPLLISHGVNWVPGRVGGAVEFGMFSGASIPNVTVGQSHTVSMWIQPTGGAVWTRLLAAGCCAGMFYRADLQKISYSYPDTAGGANHLTNAVIPVGGWIHVAVASSPTGVSIYLNGVLDSTHPAPTLEVFQFDGFGYPSGFQGLLDEIRVYDRTLNPAELFAIYSYWDAGVPTISSFDSSPDVSVSGQPVTLSWDTSNAADISITPAVGAVPASGSVTVHPTITTTYAITARNAVGDASATKTVTVVDHSPNVVELNADVILTGPTVWELSGTPEQHTILIANGHRFIVPDSSWRGRLTLAYVDVYGAGTDSLNILGGSTAGSYVYLAGATVDIHHSDFRLSGGFNLFSGPGASVRFNDNTYHADNLVPAVSERTLSREWFLEVGTSTVTKYFQGNHVYRSWIDVNSPNWVVGAPPDCRSDCDEAGNIMSGPRAGFGIGGAGSYAAYNYVHTNLDVTPGEPVWTQVSGIHRVGAGAVAEHNIVHTAQWTANVIDGELRYNVLSELHPHNYVRLGNGGRVHHNITLTLYPGIDRYSSDRRLAVGESAFGLPTAGNNLSVYNNTVDGRGKAVVSLLSAVAGTVVTSFRNNVGYRLYLPATLCPGRGAPAAITCTSAVGPALTDGFVTPPVPGRLLYADFNNVFFDARSPRQVVYDLSVVGKQLGESGWGLHDLGVLNGQGLDPRFRGPLPIGSGETGFGTANDSGFPFNESDILARSYRVSDMLEYFRWVYAPAAGSPLVGAQDPADGPGDIGAVQIDSLPASAPSIVTINKRPMVYAGPSFPIANAGVTAKLSGYGADDGLPANLLTFNWRKVSGPGLVIFGDPSNANTTAQFGALGVYVLRLTASDGALTSTSDATVWVGTPPANGQ